MPKEGTASIDEALKAAEWLTEEELQQEQQKIIASWARRSFKRIPGRPCHSTPECRSCAFVHAPSCMSLTRILSDAGLPPSWARRRTAEEHVERFGDLSCAVLWRRKLLLPDQTSRRPAYFGSWRKSRSASHSTNAPASVQDVVCLDDMS